MRTVRDYLEQLPEPFRSKALEIASEALDKESTGLANCIAQHIWSDNAKDNSLWSTVYSAFQYKDRCYPEPPASWNRKQLNGIDL